MINPALFAACMLTLSSRFGRELEPTAQRWYYLRLSELLSDDEFSTACRLVFESERFWPPPDEVVAKVKPVPSLALEAAETWHRLQAAIAISANGARYLPPDVRKGLGGAAERALVAVGYSRIVAGESATLEFARREFVALYEAARREELAAERLHALAPDPAPLALLGGGRSA